MKLSEIVDKIQEFICTNGDRDISNVDIIQESSVFSANRIGDFEIIEDEGDVTIVFDREKIERYTIAD